MQEHDLIHLFSRRADLIECIREDVQDKRELEGIIGISRSTLNRRLNELEEAHLIKRKNGRYVVTSIGETAYQMYLQTFKPVSESLPILKHIPDSIYIPPAVLHDAEVINSELPDPELPFNHLEKLVKSGAEIKGVSPVTVSRFIQLFTSQASKEELSLDLIFSQECIDYLSERFQEQMAPIRQSSNCTLFETKEQPPFNLIIVDGVGMWLGIHDQKGGLRGAILNNSNEAIKWALSIYQQELENSNQVTI